MEDTLTRMGTAYGAARMNAFVITSSIVVTMTLPSGTGRHPDPPRSPLPAARTSPCWRTLNDSEPPVLRLILLPAGAS